ncbi:MAG: sigma 54-interacting transcriptional regulator [Candidatus Sulfotelmatobacter sp.]
MRPRLVVLSGPLKDSTIPLREGEITIGREASNGIAVTDPSVSRKHCRLSCQDGRYRVQDLGSRNGTRVNGTLIHEEWLQHGDEIYASDSSFLFLLEDEDPTPVGQVEFSDAQFTAETTVIHPRDAVYLQPDRLLRELPATSRVARNLNALFKISRIVPAIRDLDELQGQLLELIFEVVPASRGAILLADKKGQVNSRFARIRQEGQVPWVKVSRTIAQKVLEQGIAILAIDVPGSKDLREVESLAASDVRSLLCVPLTVFQRRVIGCIYLDSDSLSNRLSEEHLQLVTAIAGFSAVALEKVRRLSELEEENRRLTVEISQDWSLIGESERMKEVNQFIKQAASTDSKVLIEGESGTGKELVARELHRNSPRASERFMAINCAAIPNDLLESELFGHERGAFTGAGSLKKGKFEIASGGVVFLDEIGEMDPALQVKLLRVLQEGEFERVGGTRPIKVDIRLIAATNCNLEQAVRDGRFRQDLYYRLNVLRMKMPTLRDRKDDIHTLALHFVQKHAERCKVKPKPISPEALACLINYDWPGNVRELENAIERALVMGDSDSDSILREDLPESLLECAPTPEMTEGKYHFAIRESKKKLVLDAMDQARGNYAEAARILGMHPNNLHRLIRKLGLKDILKERYPRG